MWMICVWIWMIQGCISSISVYSVCVTGSLLEFGFREDVRRGKDIGGDI